MGARQTRKARPLVITVFGTRPQYIKLAVLWRKLETQFRSMLIDSGQHYDWELAGALQEDTGLRIPDMHLGIGSAAPAVQISRVADALDSRLSRLKPDAVIVIGDTSTTAGGAIAASYRGIPVAHVEAGLRSFDRSAPEEKNRILADHLAHWRFCPTRAAMDHLRAEGIREGVHGVGDLMYEHWLERYPTSQSVELPNELRSGGYYYLTAHRAENVDPVAQLTKLVRILESLESPVVYPVHPRTKRSLSRVGLWNRLRRQKRLLVLSPIAYSVSLALVGRAKAVLTDSGGVQREAHWCRIPCVVLREVTEWPGLLDSRRALTGLDWRRVKSALKLHGHIQWGRDRVFANRHPARAIVRQLAHDLSP